MKVIKALIRNPSAMETLFKPVQRNIIEKKNRDIPLSENEQRYLRGNLGKKLIAIESLLKYDDSDREENLNDISLPEHHITGFEALKYNGFGWYFDTKIIDMVNCELNGVSEHDGKKIRLIKRRTLKNRGYRIDEKTGIKYATNYQILFDAYAMKNRPLIHTCETMRDRYGDVFIDEEMMMERV